MINKVRLWTKDVPSMGIQNQVKMIMSRGRVRNDLEYLFGHVDIEDKNSVTDIYVGSKNVCTVIDVNGE